MDFSWKQKDFLPKVYEIFGSEMPLDYVNLFDETFSQIRYSLSHI